MPQSSTAASGEAHTNVTVTRRSNLLALRQQFAEGRIAAGESPIGLGQAFAKHLELSPSMLSQIQAARPVSDKLARQIEAHCGKAPGWLDEVHQADVPNQALEAFLHLASKAWLASNGAQRRLLKQSLKAALDSASARAGPKPE